MRTVVAHKIFYTRDILATVILVTFVDGLHVFTDLFEVVASTEATASAVDSKAAFLKKAGLLRYCKS